MSTDNCGCYPPISPDIRDDFQGGCVVCINCGYVIDSKLFVDPLTSRSLSQIQMKKITKETVTCSNASKPKAIVEKLVEEKKLSIGARKKLAWGKELLVNICKNNQLTDDIVKNASVLLEAFISKMAKRGVQINISVYTGFALYVSCVNHGVPRSKIESANMFFVSVKQLNKLESELNKNQTYIDVMHPSQVLPRVYILCDKKVSFKTCQALAEMADKLENEICAHPLTVLAYVIYKYLNSSVFQKTLSKENYYSMNFVCSIIGITPATIQRLLKMDLPDFTARDFNAV